MKMTAVGFIVITLITTFAGTVKFALLQVFRSPLVVHKVHWIKFVIIELNVHVTVRAHCRIRTIGWYNQGVPIVISRNHVRVSYEYGAYYDHSCVCSRSREQKKKRKSHIINYYDVKV